MTQTAIIALGSNLDNPQEQIKQAIAAIKKLPEIVSLTVSSLYCSTPVGYKEQPDFINAVALAKVHANCTAEQLLHVLQQIEQDFGRVRSFQNAPRTLDLDLIDFNHEISHDALLTLPHPRAHERSFVMQPLAEIAPDYPIGTHGCAADLATQLGNAGIVRLKP